MKINCIVLPAWMFCALALALNTMPVPLSAAKEANSIPEIAPTKTAEAIPWSQIGAKVGADYKGDGLSVIPTESGARLRCVFQRLEGEATAEGLWLTSTVTNTLADRFQVKATAVERQTSSSQALPAKGTVSVSEKLVSFVRPGLREEYSVSMGGVRQDFLVLQRPAGAGDLQVRLQVAGAQVESAPGGAQLLLAQSGRKITYSHLNVTDANGRELPARIEVASPTRPEAARGLTVIVSDAEAVYPVRIDPTFSDANWSSLNPGIPGVDNPVYAAVVDSSGNLYIGGAFSVAGNTTAHYIAKWDGSSWSALGSGMNSNVLALAVSGSDLYAGGQFTMAGGSPANYIAKWDGSSWATLGSGMNSNVYALAVAGTGLYAGGQFTNAGGSAANRIAKWDGNSWSALDSGIDNTVYALAVSGSNLYAGGRLASVGGTSAASYIVKWDGSSWSALGSGTGSTVRALIVSGSDVYAGCDFAIPGTIAPTYIAKWNGNSWATLGSGMKGGVWALAVLDADLYAGGGFTTANGSPANYIAKWNGSSWSALGGGMNDVVYALAVSGSDVYAGGQFTTATNGDGAPVTVNCIARWNGSSWSALGEGMFLPFSSVNALAVSGTDLYAGGHFFMAGNNVVNNIARWDGSSWSALGSGVNSDVLTLAVLGSDLYAGGQFTMAGGIAASRIAKWNGSSWSALGTGVNTWVFALAVAGSDLYAGGDFTAAGGNVANRIAKWDGSSWSALGAGINSRVKTLTVSGTDVYAGGYFTAAGGSPANYIAKWDGSSWSTLGAGMNNYVFALALAGNDLYVGGDFTTAGGKVSGCAAKATLAAVNPIPLQISLAGPNTATLNFTGSPNSQYLVQFATNLTTSPWWPLATNTAAANGLATVQDPTATNAQRFYRVSRP